jgi:hypothetical protein
VAYVFYYGGAILSWYSKLFSFVTTNTNHSEYAALALGAKEAQWFVYLFQQLEPSVKHTPVPLYVDNSGVISMVFNPVDHQANKHVRINCHYGRELTEEGTIVPQRVPSEKNLADQLTKALGGAAFKAMVDQFVKIRGNQPILDQSVKIRTDQSVKIRGGASSKSTFVRGGVLSISQS